MTLIGTVLQYARCWSTLQEGNVLIAFNKDQKWACTYNPTYILCSVVCPDGKYGWFEEYLTAFKPRSKADSQGINLVLTILATPLLGISSPPFQSEVCKS